MKITRILTMAIVLVGLTGVARAITFRVLDPPGYQPGSPDILSLNSPIDFSFYQCPPGFSGDGCFSAVNYTGSVITTFSATINSSTSLSDLGCSTDPYDGFSSFAHYTECSLTNSGETITVAFSGGGVRNGSTLWIIEDGAADIDFSGPTNSDPDAPYAGTFSVGAAPEPASLWMALTSLAPLGYALRRRRGAVKG